MKKLLAKILATTGLACVLLVGSSPNVSAEPSSVGRAHEVAKARLTGKLNLNTATKAQLQLLPSVGPAKAERIIQWRTRHRTFARVADLRRVHGFGYKTVKRLEPYLDVRGDNTLVWQ